MNQQSFAMGFLAQMLVATLAHSQLAKPQIHESNRRRP
jgi:hypothetical protein